MNASKSYKHSSNPQTVCFKAANVIFFLLSFFIFLAAFKELFIIETGVHIPRIQLLEKESNIPWMRLFSGAALSDISLHYIMNVSTTCWIIILFSSLFSFIISIRLLVNLFHSRPKLTIQKLFVLVLFLFFIQLVAYIFILNSTFSSVGDFG